MKSKHYIFLLLVSIFIFGCSVKMPWQSSGSVPELVDIGVYRGPRPDFQELKKLNIGVIIDLEDEESEITKELVSALNNGMYFISFPMSEVTPPTKEYLLEIVNSINKNRGDNVYVHCRRGIDRTGYAIAKYRMVYNGWSFEKSFQEMLDHRHSAIYFSSWKNSLKP